MKIFLSFTALILATSTIVSAQEAKENDKTNAEAKATTNADAKTSADTKATADTKTTAKPKRDPEVVFKRLDADSDGAISKLEWNSSRRAKQNAERAEKAFTARDKDADGKLSKEEFTAPRTRKSQK
jgi:hypothetical protein